MLDIQTQINLISDQLTYGIQRQLLMNLFLVDGLEDI